MSQLFFFCQNLVTFSQNGYAMSGFDLVAECLPKVEGSSAIVLDPNREHGGIPKNLQNGTVTMREVRLFTVTNDHDVQALD
jgi:hypothetical protein